MNIVMATILDSVKGHEAEALKALLLACSPDELESNLIFLEQWVLNFYSAPGGDES